MSATVFDAFSTAAAHYPGHPFLHIPAAACSHYSEHPIDLAYAELLRQANRLSVRYTASGYGSGQRVALMLENRPQFFQHWLALNRLGVSVVPINAEQSAAEIVWMLEHSEACLIVALPEHLSRLEVANRMLTQALPIHDSSTETPPYATQTSGLDAPGAHSECALLYTSGSTGKPKGCILGNTYFTRCGEWYRDVGGLCALRDGAERLITPLPLSHMNAMATSTMGMIMTGGCIVQLDRFHPSSWWRSVRESGATVLHYLGVMPAILLSMPEADGDKFGDQVRFGFGAGVNPRHHVPFERRFGFPLIEAWAMTESGCAGCIVANQEPRHVGSSNFGKPSAAVEYRLVDEQGQDVSFASDGELLVRASGADPRAGFFSGYLKNAEASAEIWAGGWLHTGDVARRNEDGSLHFVDRRKNVIRRSGENIAALEVEAALVDDPRIDQVVVTAAPDEMRGDEVMACVIAKLGVAADIDTAAAIQQRALAVLAYFKAPGYVVFVDTIPRTASQKPQRGEIKKLAAQWLQSEHCFDLRSSKRRADTVRTTP